MKDVQVHSTMYKYTHIDVHSTMCMPLCKCTCSVLSTFCTSSHIYYAFETTVVRVWACVWFHSHQADTHTHTHILTHTTRTYSCTFCTMYYVHMYVCIYLHSSSYVVLCSCIINRVWSHTHTYIYIEKKHTEQQACAHNHRRTHTHTQTHTQTHMITRIL